MREMNAQDATSVDEKPLAKWLFQGLPAARMLGREFRFEAPSRVFFEIPTIELVPGARGPGDVDVLVASSECPQRSVAFEVKRVKVDAATFATGAPGKVAKLKQGVQQVNLLCELGFHRAYLLVAIVTDGRERDVHSFPFRGPTPEILRIIREFPSRDKLHPHAGLALVEMTQPVDKDIQFAGSIGMQICVEAREVEQSAHLSIAISRLLQGADAQP